MGERKKQVLYLSVFPGVVGNYTLRVLLFHFNNYFGLEDSIIMTKPKGISLQI